MKQDIRKGIKSSFLYKRFAYYQSEGFIELMKFLEKENILDLFGGSGSTMIACEQLNRNCYMMELDPKYCQVIINRWEEFTGEKAEKILEA